MDFPTLHQHIDALLEQEQCVDAQILIDEQLTHPKYSGLTTPTQAHLPLWEEKWQLQLLTCKSLTIQFKPNEAILLADKVLEESRLLDEFTSKTQVLGMTAKAYALLFLGRTQECQQQIKEVESLIESLSDDISQAETNNLQASLERTKCYLNSIFGHFDLALTHIQNSLHLSRQKGNNSYSVGASLIFEAEVYCDMGPFSKGLELLQKSAEYNKNRGLEYNYIWNLFILAVYLCNEGELILAEEHGLEGLKLSKEKGSKLLVAWAQTSLGKVYRARG